MLRYWLNLTVFNRGLYQGFEASLPTLSETPPTENLKLPYFFFFPLCFLGFLRSFSLLFPSLVFSFQYPSLVFPGDYISK
jgi:hypothetical protein